MVGERECAVRCVREEGGVLRGEKCKMLFFWGAYGETEFSDSTSWNWMMSLVTTVWESTPPVMKTVLVDESHKV